MNKFNIYVWVGLVLSASILGSLLYMIQGGELVVDGSNGAANAELMKTLMIIACVSFPIQIISIMVMTYKPRLSIGLTIISSLALMPITIVFAMGMIFSAIRWRYHQLTPFDTTLNINFDQQVAFNKRNNRILVGALGLISITFIILSQSLGMFLFVFTIFLGYFGKKAGDGVYLAVKDAHLYIRPNIFAHCYRIPLKDVTYVKGEKGKVYFDVQTDNEVLQLTATPANATPEEKAKLMELLSKIQK
ncbi:MULTISPECIES: hypothetical protein [Providencia]|uniref:Uncharacterized protein n=1 Tax=Providencia rettgeri TaxID=587 RepID=A0A379FUR3_PRORE|nr:MULTISPECIES: hypothetical protein [Providencia]EJD6378984.1 hypothetical protein [Providencia rettgeri]ELR5119220.1 hypothetical protein [Providencia rettgeri]MBI6202829.1 hypothetical protein [Providencia rettgeri]MCG5282424.1 hypothetical protein [Providencia rettgeri]QXB05047.1 hypothetical protein I6L80_17030 [Providencia rettgeri]